MRLLRTVSLLTVLLAMPVLADEPTVTTESSDSAFKGPGAINDRSPQHRQQMLSFFVGIPWQYFGYGFPFSVGGRYYIPIVHDGFIPALNDSFGIEFGADFFGTVGPYYGFGGFVSLPVEAMWQFHLTRDFSAYGKLGFAVQVHFGQNYFGNNLAYVTADLVAGAGIMYKVSSAVVLRAELGYNGAKIGIGFPL